MKLVNIGPVSLAGCLRHVVAIIPGQFAHSRLPIGKYNHGKIIQLIFVIDVSVQLPWKD